MNKYALLLILGSAFGQKLLAQTPENPEPTLTQKLLAEAQQKTENPETSTEKPTEALPIEPEKPKTPSVKLRNPKLTAEFHRRYTRIWTAELLEALRQYVSRAEEHALPPNRYHLSQLSAFTEDDVEQQIYTDAFLTLASDLANGLVNPNHTHREWNAKKMDDEELIALMLAAIQTEQIAGYLDGINRNNLRYYGLKHLYAKSKAEGEPQSYLNKIKINLERQRWLPQNLPEDYVLVNIPSHTVRVFEQNRSIFTTDAIIGKASKRTPAFIDEMEFLEFSPWWYPPKSLGDRPVKPGKNNPMGDVKFMFPNPHAIYLHDTNQRYLFNNRARLLSSGCIRLARPLDLAEQLLSKNQEIPNINKLINKKYTTRVNLDEKMPIYLVYWTLWTDTKELKKTTFTYDLDFADDVYGLDKKLTEQYNQALSPYYPKVYAPSEPKKGKRKKRKS